MRALMQVDVRLIWSHLHWKKHLPWQKQCEKGDNLSDFKCPSDKEAIDSVCKEEAKHEN